MYGLTSQFRRAAYSIPVYIVEACGKFYQQELAYYLNMALGFSNESDYYLLLSRDVRYLAEENYQSLYQIINEVKAMLIGLFTKIPS